MEAGVNIQKYVKDLAERATGPLHKRLINSYKGDDPKLSLENELNQILEEVVSREDCGHNNSWLSWFQ
jgi:hypothetical protein